jgi:hypothetical protein
MHQAVIAVLIILIAAFLIWGLPALYREKPRSLTPGHSADGSHTQRRFMAAAAPLPIGQDFGPQSQKEKHGGWHSHLHADPALEWYSWHDRFRKEKHGGWHSHLHADPTLEWYRKDGDDSARGGGKKPLKENYGEPPGLIRAVHRDELGFRGWSDMPGDYECNSASSVSAYVQRSA